MVNTIINNRSVVNERRYCSKIILTNKSTRKDDTWQTNGTAGAKQQPRWTGVSSSALLCTQACVVLLLICVMYVATKQVLERGLFNTHALKNVQP